MKKTVLSLLDMANTGNKFAVIVVDESDCWGEDITKKAGKIEGVYIVDLTAPTHLCELAVSFPAIQTQNFVHNAEAFTEDELFEIEYEVDRSYTYFKGTNKFKVVHYYKEGTIEEIEEEESANPSYC